jgi:hypothetical protein
MSQDESSDNRDVHDALNRPATDPDPTEWPDPYDKRPDPRDPDPEVDPRKANPHEPDKLK